jgi:hypothetical protein
MPKGKSDIPDLRIENLQSLITSFMNSPNLVLVNLFGSQNADSDTIKWESQVGNRGMTPFAAPGAPAQTTAPSGLASHSAAAAYWKEKMYMDEVFLNNLRKPGTVNTYELAQARLARETLSLRNRCDRRKEWMFAKMLTAGSISYLAPKGTKIAVDYAIPSANLVTLAANRVWDSGSQRNIVEDIMDGKLVLQNSIGAKITHAIMTTEIMKLLVLDPSIQTLLSKSNFGQGNLFAQPEMVLSALLGIPNWIVYDEQYEITAWITAAVTGSSTTAVYVDDATDFEVGGTLRFTDISAGTYEDETISAVDPEAGTVTVSTAPTASFKAGEDKVTMVKKFIPTDVFTMFSAQVEGVNIAEYFAAPYGLNRVWGMDVDTHETWDPDGLWIRVQNKGLPVLYNRDAIYSMTVT